MFHNRGANNKINYLQQRLLLIFCIENIFIFLKIYLKRDKLFILYHRNIQPLAT